MFDSELDYYGIAIPDPSSVHQDSSVGTMQPIRQTICDAELQHGMLLIAATCYNKFMSGYTSVHTQSGDVDLLHNRYFYDQNTAMEVLNDFLEKFYGLIAPRHSICASDMDSSLKVKEIDQLVVAPSVVMPTVVVLSAATV